MEQEKSYKQMSREERGEDIVNRFKIVKTPRGWRVPSTSHAGNSYLVTFNGHEPKCNCADCELRKKKCKHIHAVEFYIKKEIDEEGKITQTKGVKITYSQNWKAYDKAQTNEKLIFMKLLKDLCENVEQPKYKFGRPTLPISEMLFASALKVYSTFSLRRFISDMKIAQVMNMVDVVPNFMTISNFMNKEELTNILKELISISASPLREVETDFAVDSSGFSTSRFARWYDTKWGKERKFKVWIKAHLISGVKTNIITGCEVTEADCHDSPQLSHLVEETAKNFKVSEVSCDKAYSSRMNLELIENAGAVPYIPFKKNTSGKRVKNRTLGTWGRMYHYFMYKHEEFLEHYHKRSNAETVFSSMKAKFKDNLRSKGKTAQINELLLKVLCYNICVVIQEISELGIKGEFVVEDKG
jgi:transposase